MAAAAVIALAPITVRNDQIHGRFILISTKDPIPFVTGHVTHSSGLPPGMAQDWAGLAVLGVDRDNKARCERCGRELLPAPPVA